MRGLLLIIALVVYCARSENVSQPSQSIIEERQTADQRTAPLIKRTPHFLDKDIHEQRNRQNVEEEDEQWTNENFDHEFEPIMVNELLLKDEDGLLDAELLLGRVSEHASNQTQLQRAWLDQDCPNGCTCEFVTSSQINGELLRSVNCTAVQMHSLPIQLFPAHMERLVLTLNELQDLSLDRVFACETLLELHVTWNSLTHLTGRTHSLARTSAEHVQTHRINEVRSLKPSLLSICNRLRSLDLRGNAFGVLEAGAFKRLKRLDQLRLDACQLHSIERHSFTGLGQLRLLSLSHNKLSEINAEMFQNLNALRVLDLSHNHIQQLAGGSFSGLLALRGLELSHNHLDRLSGAALMGLESVQALFVRHNRLNAIPAHALRLLKSARLVDLSYNLQIVALRELDFAHSFARRIVLNGLRKLRRVHRLAFFDLPALLDVQIRGASSLVHLDEQAFAGTPTLRSLNVESSGLFALDARLLDALGRHTLVGGRRMLLHLAGSSFRCDCMVKPLHSCALQAQRCKVSLAGMERLTCHMPPIGNRSAENVRLLDLRSEQLPTQCAPVLVQPEPPEHRALVQRVRGRVQLLCKGYASPPTRAYWLGPDEQAGSNSHEHWLNTTSSSSNDVIGAQSWLRISHLSATHEGVYTCVMNSTLGASSRSIRLLVEQLHMRLQVEQLGSAHVTLSWQLVSELHSQNTSTANVHRLDTRPLQYEVLYRPDETTDVTNSAVDELPKNWSGFEMVQISPHLHSFTVAGLRPLRRYLLCVGVREQQLPTWEHSMADQPISNDALEIEPFAQHYHEQQRHKRSSEAVSVYLSVSCVRVSTSSVSALENSAEKLGIAVDSNTDYSQNLWSAFQAWWKRIGGGEKASKITAELDHLLEQLVKLAIGIMASTLAIGVLCIIVWAIQKRQRVLAAHETPRKTLLMHMDTTAPMDVPENGANDMCSNEQESIPASPQIPMDNILSSLVHSES